MRLTGSEVVRFRTDLLTWAAPYRGYIHPYVESIPAGIEGAVAFRHADQDYLFFPHSFSNAVAMGIPCVPPDYEWPGQFKPYDHQKSTVNFILANKSAFVLNGMGSGKTVSFLWAADQVIKLTGKPVLVIAPLSTLNHTWAKSVFVNFPHLTTSILHGGKEKRKKLLQTPASIYLCNPDGVGVIEQELKETREFSMICCDESTYFKNHRSARWKAMNAVCNAHRKDAKIVLMTGSPTAERPTDAYGQVRLADPVWCANKYPYFTNFKDATMIKVSQFIDVPKARAEDVVKAFMQPAIRFSLEECKDMPERVYITKEVHMCKEQYQAYESMRKNLLAEFRGQEITAVNAGVASMKLCQIASGIAYGAEGDKVLLPYKNRLETIVETIEETEKKVIIFAAFTILIDRLHDDLTKLGYSCAKVDGRTASSERNTIFNDFESENNPKVIIAHAKTMAHGLSLLNATTIIWAMPSQSAEEVTQAEARNFRLSSTHRCVIVRLCGSPIEEKMYARIDSKLDMQQAVLDAVAEDSKRFLV